MDAEGILQIIKDAQQGIRQVRQYHLKCALTDLEWQFSPEALAAKLITEQFGRIIREHTEHLRKRLGHAIKIDPDLNASLDDIKTEMANAIDLVGHQIIKRHFNEAFDRVDEALKTLAVAIQCQLNLPMRGD